MSITAKMRPYILLLLLISNGGNCSTRQLTVAAGDYCPYVCIEQGRPGIYIEVLRRVFPAPEFELVLRVRPWARVLLEVKNGQIDIMTGGGSRNTREFLVYADAPLFSDRLCLYGVSGMAWHYQGRQSLRDVSLGVVAHYMYPPPLNEIISDLDLKTENITDAGEKPEARMFKMLLARRFEVLPSLQSMADYILLKNNWQKRVKNVGCLPGVFEDHFAFSRKTPNVEHLLQRLNNGVARLRASGELNAILNRYGIVE